MLVPVGGEERQKVQLEVRREAAHFIILPRAFLPGRGRQEAVWLRAGAGARWPKFESWLCHFGYGTSLLCGSGSPLQNRFPLSLHCRAGRDRPTLHFTGKNVKV